MVVGEFYPQWDATESVRNRNIFGDCFSLRPLQDDNDVVLDCRQSSSKKRLLVLINDHNQDHSKCI